MKTKIKKIMDTIKFFIATLLAVIVAYLQPINNSIIVLVIVLTWDVIIGILVDLVINKDRIRIKKLLFALLFVALYTSIVASVFIIGRLMDDETESLDIVKVLTYVFVYFYTSNILRNLTLLFPNNKVFFFLYEFLGLQIVKRLPELAHLLNMGKNNNKELTSKNKEK